MASGIGPGATQHWIVVHAAHRFRSATVSTVAIVVPADIIVTVVVEAILV